MKIVKQDMTTILKIQLKRVLLLRGTEIKSIRRGSANLKDSFAQVRRGEMYLNNMHIAPYEEGNRFNHDPLRTRKLLLHKKKFKIR